jgi:hypothetical protein
VHEVEVEVGDVEVGEGLVEGGFYVVVTILFASTPAPPPPIHQKV